MHSTPAPPDDDYFNEMRALGFAESDIQTIKRTPVDESLAVLEENWVSVIWFCETQDSYRYSESGICLGLDLPQIMAEKQLIGRDVSSEDFRFLKHMGQENTRLLNASLKPASNQIERQYDAPPD
jgi:hypothetical protein